MCELYAASVVLYQIRDYAGARMQADAYRKALNEFGLTAASAGRVGPVGGDDNENPEDDFFKKPRLVK